MPRSKPIAIATLAAATLILTACATQPPHTDTHNKANQPHHETVANYLTGSFSSAQQAERDPENYFNIHLNTTRIWHQRTTPDSPAIWLYVEQAAAAALGRPYRQRVYRVTPSQDQPQTHVESAVFTLPEPALQFAGAHIDPARFDNLSPTDLTPRDGCTVYLTHDPASNTYTGSTRGNACASSLAGATYATSIVTITPNTILSLDQGFDAQSNQVWGATEGPYEFVRNPTTKQ